MKIKAKFVYKERLDYLIVEEDALRKSLMVVEFRYRKLLHKALWHFFVVYLEGTHDIFSANNEVHQTGNKSSWRVYLRLITYG